MKDYNGFSASQRTKVGNIQKKAIADGIWNYERKCSMCGLENDKIMFHNEDYNTIFEGYPLCIECHLRLHARYSKPNVWKKYMLFVRNGGKGRNWGSVYEFIKGDKYQYDLPFVEFVSDTSKWWEVLTF